MIRKLGAVCAIGVFALATMGQESCGTDEGGNGGGKNNRQGLLNSGATGNFGQNDSGGGNNDGGAFGGNDGGNGGESESASSSGDDFGSGGSGCEPGYSPCVPSYPPDVDCDDVGQTVSVSGSDPHGLDADSDGSGCE